MTVNILKSDVGEISINDIEEASTCKADIFSFGCEVNFQAASLISSYQIVPKIHKLIHTFLKDFEQSAINKKKVFIKGVEKGRGIIADVFPIKGKKGGPEIVYVPGVKIEAGKIGKTHKLYVFRNGSPASDGVFARNIKVFKKEMSQVKKGDECTITMDLSPDFKLEKGDEIVAY